MIFRYIIAGISFVKSWQCSVSMAETITLAQTSSYQQEDSRNSSVAIAMHCENRYCLNICKKKVLRALIFLVYQQICK